MDLSAQTGVIAQLLVVLVVENLAATLQELNVPEQHIAEVAALCETTRNDILGK
ncbi:hypothetical protein TPL01_16070 [Sulfuriferula plumbiphila]|uniref:Uncharacterized protein n=1 Tax=Sulfuriferula plumbiphila TaxID=171865 RepID=A0A512L7K1_9PROT|nr:hypothetical protein [Sulfuriferula plumbiphila]BBP04014.1 hypothetical protein SFPGR_14360 [Sulfuriferula plumbiphila]GEP30469.1 hypothetical protein TPL01_16070 [Sulfuriferula plumbiphila]